ncbi:hypothetical protein WNY59_08215 [Ahrensia kielensis]|uniref:SAM domain-containing protein n=1 Tax=Ahrensia kielensis TaxID=76980 RepID=A0ABU9T619_9HYPH
MRRAREEKFADIPLQELNEADWPDHVRSLGIDELANLGIDKKGHVYWMGKLVTVQRRLTLTKAQKVGALIVAVAAVFASIATVVQGLISYNEWACQSASTTFLLSCPI